jgi:hypothetical protein
VNQDTCSKICKPGQGRLDKVDSFPGCHGDDGIIPERVHGVNNSHISFVYVLQHIEMHVMCLCIDGGCFSAETTLTPIT